jgi:hypothetical protein
MRTAKLVTVMSGAKKPYSKKVLALSPVVYFKMTEPSGTVLVDSSGNARNGTYTNVTVANAAGPIAGTVAPLFDGSTSYGSIYSAGFAGALPANTGSFSVWAKMSAAGVWTDGVGRRLLYLGNSVGTQIFVVQRTTTNNQMTLLTGNRSGTDTDAGGNTGWFHLASTWDATSGRFNAYYNGALFVAEQTGFTGMAGTLAAARALVGSSYTAPGNVWSGWIAQMAFFATELTPAQILTLATP